MSSVEIAKQLLIDFKSVMDKHRVTFWLDASTLLAITREGRLFEHDAHDQDVGIYQEDFDKFAGLIPEFESVGLRLADRFEHPSGLSNEFRLSRDGHHLDIFIKPKRDGRRWWLSYLGEPGRIETYIPHHVEADHFDKLVTIPLWGGKWKIPSRVDDYLTDTYGDWRTPTKDWRWDVDPRCIDHSWEIR